MKRVMLRHNKTGLWFAPGGFKWESKDAAALCPEQVAVVRATFGDQARGLDATEVPAWSGLEREVTKRSDEDGLIVTRAAVARMPSRPDVLAVAVGTFQPDCFGRLSRVTKIQYTGVDCKGRAFVGYMCAMSETDTAENGCGCSNSMKEGELVRTVALTCILNSAECDALEAEMRLWTESSPLPAGKGGA